MKKEIKYGTIYLTSEEQTKFVNATAAMMACHCMQWYYAEKGYFTTNSINLNNDRVELTVHFDWMPVAPTPSGYPYTQKEITSHGYYSPAYNAPVRVRTITFYFKF